MVFEIQQLKRQFQETKDQITLLKNYDLKIETEFLKIKKLVLQDIIKKSKKTKS